MDNENDHKLIIIIEMFFLIIRYLRTYCFKLSLHHTFIDIYQTITWIQDGYNPET